MANSNMMCFGYWAHRPDGFAELDRIASQLGGNEITKLPAVPEPLNARISGIRTKDVFYAQTLLDQAGSSRWPVPWQSLKLYGGLGHVGLQLERCLENAGPAGRITQRSIPFRKRVLSREEVRQTFEALGWSSAA
jgi:hypothetical protein